jgi:large conductance mechanosensitive channel
MKKLYEEFKEFAFKGDIVSLAIAFVMASAFAAVVNALVETVVMPIVGIIFGEPSFNGLVLTINDSVIFYGAFITAVVKFVAVALGVFFFIVKPYQAYQNMKKQDEAVEAPAAPDEQVILLREILDALKK